MFVVKNDAKTFLAYAAVCFFWGSTFLGIKVGLAYWPPLLMAGIRFILASLILFPIISSRKIEFSISLIDFKTIILGGVFMLSFSNGLLCISEKFTSSSLAAVMIALVPIYTAGMEAYQNRQINYTLTNIFGMIMSVLGVLVLTWSDMSLNMNGLFLLVISGLCWSVGALKTKTVSERINPLLITMIQMFAGGILLIMMSSITEEWLNIPINISSVTPILYLSLFGSVIAFSCYNYVLKHWTAVATSTYTYINPIVAIILGNAFLNERITINTIIGVTIILFGTRLVRIKSI